MTREEAIHKMEYSKRAYQMLIDEKVQEGVLVGQGINAEWSADTPIIDAYKDMLEACDMAIKALEQKPCSNAIDRAEAIRVASGYCHFSNIPKELAKLPPVTPEPCEVEAAQQTYSKGFEDCRQAVIDLIEHYNSDGLGSVFYGYQEGVKFADAVNKLSSVNPQEPSGETVSLEAFKQVMRERDIAIEQLHELGYEWGQKIEPSGDAISRQAAFEAFGLSEKSRKYSGDHSGYDTLMKYEIQDVLESLPPVTPQQPCGDAIDSGVTDARQGKMGIVFCMSRR